VDALKGDDKRAEPMIELISRLHAIERDAAGLDPLERLARSQTEVLDYCADKPELDDIARLARLGMAASLLEVSLGKYPQVDVRHGAAHLYGTGDRNIDSPIAQYGAASHAQSRWPKSPGWKTLELS
jgi:hypothetical protein